MNNPADIKYLISCYLDGEVTLEEKRIVEDALRKDPALKKYLDDLKKVSASLSSWTDENLSPDLEQKLERHIQSAGKGEGRTMTTSSFSIPMKTGAAAVAALLVLITVFINIERNEQLARLKSIRQVNEQIALSTLDSKQSQSSDQPVPSPVYGQKGQTEIQPLALREQEKYEADVLSDKLMAPVTEKKIDEGFFRIEQTAGERADKSKVDRVAKAETPKTLEMRATEIAGAMQAEPYKEANRRNIAVARSTESVASTKDGYLSSSAGPAQYYSLGGQIPAAPYPSKGRISDGEMYYPISPAENFNTEEYDRIYENAFLSSVENPLSTFSIDVDTASYSNIRRFLNGGQMPPKDAVRIEEMVNYFVYDYPQPASEEPFSITTEAAPCPWNPSHVLALIGLKGKELTAVEAKPSNLVFLIDVSGSMDEPNKLPLLQSAFRMMVNQLKADERIAIVTYAGAAGLVLDSTQGNEKPTILSAIDHLQAGGSTAGGAGIQLAYDVAKRNFIPGGNNRVILATDGDFNVGVSSDSELVRLIEEERDAGIFLTVLGFGTGNYKDAKMEKIADKGNGNYYYIDSINEAQKVLMHELGSTLFTIAKDVKVQIEFNPAHVKAYRLIGYENRMLAKEDFNDDTKDAGELGAGHTVTALYELIPADSGEEVQTTDELRYQKREAIPSNEVMTVKLRYKKPEENTSRLITRILNRQDISQSSVSDNWLFASSVAEFGLLLRDSQYKGNASYQTVLERAQPAKGQDPWGYRAEFIHLVEKAGMLNPGPTPVPVYMNK